MAKEPVLVVMAAGMGSRYGGLKQIDAVGSHGEAILDYSLYDAYEAGFRTAVIIIKEAIKKDFMETVGVRLQRCPMEIRYAYQEVSHVPAGFQVPEGRTKPWGTSHAVLCAGEQIGDAPFAVINADDYYGKSGFQEIYHFLHTHQDTDQYQYCMVGYQLGNTVTENGFVSRGVCQKDDQGYLIEVVERTRIEMYQGGIHFTEDEGKSWQDLPFETTVSMNLWGFTPSFLKELEKRFPVFLKNAAGRLEKAEMYLPSSVTELLEEGKAQVKVLHSADKWHGVTYAADKHYVTEALKAMTEQGKYPDGLWK